MANADTIEVSIMGTGGFGASLQGILDGWVDDRYDIDSYIKNPYPASAYVFGLAGPSMDESTDEAHENLAGLIAGADGQVVVAGLSQGAIGATKALNGYLAALSGTATSSGAFTSAATAVATAPVPSPAAVSSSRIAPMSSPGSAGVPQGCR